MGSVALPDREAKNSWDSAFVPSIPLDMGEIYWETSPVTNDALEFEEQYMKIHIYCVPAVPYVTP